MYLGIAGPIGPQGPAGQSAIQPLATCPEDQYLAGFNENGLVCRPCEGQGTKVALTVRFITEDTTIVTGVPLLLKAVAIDPADKSRAIATTGGFRWALDGANFSNTTDIGQIEHTFDTEGTFTIWVQAIDNDGLRSEPDMVVVVVAPPGMKLIPSGGKTFTMGNSSGGESQQVSFTKDFYMDSTEVTQKQYNDLMTTTYTGYTTTSWTTRLGLGDNNPAYFVNWYDAVLYCNARSKEAGKDTVYTYDGITGTTGNDCVLTNVAIDYDVNGFRLPTEAEWEYAARAGTTTDYYWGKDYNPYPATTADTNEVNSYSVNRYNSHDKGIDTPDFGTHVVATKLPNAFGLYDMSGNVWEWCGDRYGLYSNSAEVDPSGATTGSRRILRGGCWYDAFGASFLRSGRRHDIYPEFEGTGYGFRVVCP